MGRKNAGPNAASPSLLCDLGAVSSSLNLRLFVGNVGPRIPTLECSIRGQREGPGWCWEGTVCREGVARPGLTSSLRQAAPGDGAGTCAEFSARGPVPGGWSWQLEAGDMNKIFPQVRADLNGSGPGGTNPGVKSGLR